MNSNLRQQSYPIYYNTIKINVKKKLSSSTCFFWFLFIYWRLFILIKLIYIFFQFIEHICDMFFLGTTKNVWQLFFKRCNEIMLLNTRWGFLLNTRWEFCYKITRHIFNIFISWEFFSYHASIKKCNGIILLNIIKLWDFILL